MKDIFADLYKKVLNFFSRTDAEGENAKDVACNRLKLVLMQDRTNLTPAIMERMRKELIELLSKYVELDRELLDLNFEHEDEQMALMLSIPVIRAKNEEEVLAILDKEDEEKRRLKDLLGEEYDDEDEDEDEDEDTDESDETDGTEDSEEKPEVKSKKELKKEKFFKKKKNSESKASKQEDKPDESTEADSEQGNEPESEEQTEEQSGQEEPVSEDNSQTVESESEQAEVID